MVAKGASKSKWGKYKILTKSDVRTYVPTTYRLTMKHFMHMLGQYGGVVVKPLNGYGGDGVIRIRDAGYGRYEIRHEENCKEVYGAAQAYDYVMQIKKSSTMIVQ